MREEKEHAYALHNSEKDELINGIIKIEWDMFDKVNNLGGRAYCQDDDWTFYAMRYSQSFVLSDRTLKAYQNDLRIAVLTERNMVMEKYAYMMEKTNPDYYKEKLKKHMPVIRDEELFLIRTIANQMVSWELEFSKKYPKFGAAGRPVQNDAKDTISMRSYAECELKTYSHNTLQAYLDDVNGYYRHGENMVYKINEKIASFYGYGSVAEAEKNM